MLTMADTAHTPHARHLDIDVPVRWTDLDAYGHVNNAAIVRLLEEARIGAFWPAPEDQVALGAPAPAAALPGGGAGSSISTVIASQRIEYVRSLGHRRDGAVVRLWLSRLGGASLSVDYLVLTRDDPEGSDPTPVPAPWSSWSTPPQAPPCGWTGRPAASCSSSRASR